MSFLGRLHRTLIYDRRVSRLSELLSQVIPPECSLLDVGSGDGKLAWTIVKNRPDLSIEGIDVLIRNQPWIPVKPFDGRNLPYPDSSFDAVTLVDVLHHTLEPLALLREALRVSRRWLVVKDHVLQGLAAGLRLRLMDYAGNADHRVALPYNYISGKQWQDFQQMLKLRLIEKKTRLKLYPWPLDYTFGSGLHFVALYEKKKPGIA
ncbi:MAG: class I SAM-dependent methyltransferase [Terriglobales bacterium]